MSLGKGEREEAGVLRASRGGAKAGTPPKVKLGGVVRSLVSSAEGGASPMRLSQCKTPFFL